MELRMTARQMERQSQKIEQQEKAERKKILDVSCKSELRITCDWLYLACESE